MSDWTADPETHRANSSPAYLELVAAVGQLIRDEAHALIRGQTHAVARTIVSQLAHVHGLGPTSALEELVAACEDAFDGDAVRALPDDADVTSPGTGITFGMIRRARLALPEKRA